jgi:glyoxylase-like metal-dependent hydrolase (beta-lactamase superfamily II)
VHELEPGLRYWTAPHPAWRRGRGWEEDVRCVYYEAPDALVLIDPLVPRDREDEFWRELDSNLPVRVLLTAPWHRRDADTVADRLGGTVTRHPLPSGVEEFAAGPQEENQVAFFIRPHRTLVVAEFFQGTPTGLVVAPSPADPEPQTLVPRLRDLLELPIERVLVSHGAPILTGGRDAIREALESR